MIYYPKMTDLDRASRLLRRADWPVRRYRLGDEPGEDISAFTTAEERLAMVQELTAAAWLLSGKPIADYPRSSTPGRVIRPDR